MIDMSLEMLADLMPSTSKPWSRPPAPSARTWTRRFELAVDFPQECTIASRGRTRQRLLLADNVDSGELDRQPEGQAGDVRSRPPAAYDFTSSLDCFAASSYKYILYGMGPLPPTMEGAAARHPHIEERRGGSSSASPPWRPAPPRPCPTIARSSITSTPRRERRRRRIGLEHRSQRRLQRIQPWLEGAQ